MICNSAELVNLRSHSPHYSHRQASVLTERLHEGIVLIAAQSRFSLDRDASALGRGGCTLPHADSKGWLPGSTYCMMIYIGTSGWSYDHWQGVLYPHSAPQRDRLAYYVQHFPTVEINSTYYRWPSDSTFVSWRQRVPEGFRITIKAPRGLTHATRLYAPEAWLARISRSLWELNAART